MWLFDLLFSSLLQLICRGTDISKCFRESLGIRDNESRLYLHKFNTSYNDFWLLLRNDRDTQKAESLYMLIILVTTGPELDELKKSKRKVQGVPQSKPQPFHDTKRKRETDKLKHAQIEQTYEKH